MATIKWKIRILKTLHKTKDVMAKKYFSVDQLTIFPNNIVKSIFESKINMNWKGGLRKLHDEVCTVYLI